MQDAAKFSMNVAKIKDNLDACFITLKGYIDFYFIFFITISNFYNYMNIFLSFRTFLKTVIVQTHQNN